MMNWQAVIARIKTTLMRRGRSADDADDLIQDAWLRLENYQRDHVVERPEAFLMQTALNLSIDLYRASDVRGEAVPLDENTLVDPAPDVEATLLARERMTRIDACIMNRLKPKTRAIFLAHRVHGMTYQQIAREHRLSVSAVEKHMAKALLELTSWMEGW